jgi:CheY-like chemotaxis protein
VTDQADIEPAARQAHRKKSFAILADGYAKDLFTTGMILQKLDYDVYIVNSAEDALRIVAAAMPTLIITELVLPQMSGLELLVRIKHDEQTKKVPVIIHTASDDEQKKTLCRATGCAAFLKKPVDPAALYSTIQLATEKIPRQFIRLRTLLPAMVGGAGSQTGMDYVTELSEGGVFIRTLNPRPVDAVLPVTIIIRSLPIKVKAKVVRSVTLSSGLFQEPGMGMKFLDISGTDREVLRNVIKGQILKDITGS